MDAMQDTFVRVSRHADRLDDRAPASLLYRMATHVCLNEFRSRKRRPETPDQELLQQIACTLESGLHDARSLLRRLFRGERESTQLLAVLHFVDGLTLEQTVREVGLSLSGAESTGWARWPRLALAAPIAIAACRPSSNRAHSRRSLIVTSWMMHRASSVSSWSSTLSRFRYRYAVSDARSVADVLERLGGLAAEDRVVLATPSREEFVNQLFRFTNKVRSAREAGQRVEALMYYSGHSNETGLLLGVEAFSYRDLREAFSALDADVRVAIIDSCASGALTRSKGGKHGPALRLDASAQARGSAILTSASASAGIR